MIKLADLADRAIVNMGGRTPGIHMKTMPVPEFKPVMLEPRLFLGTQLNEEYARGHLLTHLMRTRHGVHLGYATEPEHLTNPKPMKPEQQKEKLMKLFNNEQYVAVFKNGVCVSELSGKLSREKFRSLRGILADRFEIRMVIENGHDIDEAQDCIRNIRDNFPPGSKLVDRRYSLTESNAGGPVFLSSPKSEKTEHTLSELELEVIRVALREIKMFAHHAMPQPPLAGHEPPMIAWNALMLNTVKSLLDRLGEGNAIRKDLDTSVAADI